MPTVNLEKLSWKVVETYLRSDDRIILPVGSTEQHGVFAPLGTDTYVAQAIADEAGQKARVLVAPAPLVWLEPSSSGQTRHPLRARRNPHRNAL